MSQEGEPKSHDECFSDEAIAHAHDVLKRGYQEMLKAPENKGAAQKRNEARRLMTAFVRALAGDEGVQKHAKQSLSAELRKLVDSKAMHELSYKRKQEGLRAAMKGDETERTERDARLSEKCEADARVLLAAVSRIRRIEEVRDGKLEERIALELEDILTTDPRMEEWEGQPEKFETWLDGMLQTDRDGKERMFSLLKNLEFFPSRQKFPPLCASTCHMVHALAPWLCLA